MKSNNATAINELIDHDASKIVLINLRDEWAYTEQELVDYGIPDSVEVYNISLFMDNLAAYGITNFTTPCMYSDIPCDESLLYDSYGHPASGWHKAFAEEMEIQYFAVPVPASIWLFGSALLGIAGLQRRGA